MMLKDAARFALDQARLAVGPRQLAAFVKAFPSREPSVRSRSGKPSVCLVEGWLGPGGAERQLCALAAALHDQGHAVRVRVLSLKGRGGHYLPRLRAKGIDAAEIRPADPATLTPERRRLIRLIPRSLRAPSVGLAAELTETPCDIVHAFYDHPNIFGSWAALLARIPAIRCSWRNKNPQGMFYYAPYMAGQYKLLARLRNLTFEANAVFCAQSYADWLNLDASAVDIVPNVLDPEFAAGLQPDARSAVRRELGIPENAGVIIFSGRLAPEKRPFDMLRVFTELLQKTEAVHCIIAGSDFLDEQFGLEARKLAPAQQHRLHILGLRRDMARLLAAADILLLTSETEGLSNSVMEAMHMGLPVVATDAGGTPELVSDGHNGFLTEVGNIADLVAKLLMLTADPDLRQKMGRAGKERIAAYNPAALYANISNAYQKALGLA